VDAPPDVDAIADAFVDLPLADGAGQAIGDLHAAGLATGILTNASERTLGRVAERLGLPFDHLLSVDAVRRFKPHPSVYQLAVDATGLPPDRIGFVSANGWDARGAAAFGLRVVWLRPGPFATLPAVGTTPPLEATWPDVPAIFRGPGSRPG
jgi:2-haloacid dehalogenase